MSRSRGRRIINRRPSSMSASNAGAPSRNDPSGATRSVATSNAATRPQAGAHCEHAPHTAERDQHPDQQPAVVIPAASNQATTTLAAVS